MKKSFSEFLEQIDLNALYYDCARFGISGEKQEIPFSKEQSHYIAKTIVGTSLAMLQAYHDWLNREPL